MVVSGQERMRVNRSRQGIDTELCAAWEELSSRLHSLARARWQTPAVLRLQYCDHRLTTQPRDMYRLDMGSREMRRELQELSREPPAGPSDCIALPGVCTYIRVNSLKQACWSDQYGILEQLPKFRLNSNTPKKNLGLRTGAVVQVVGPTRTRVLH